MKTPCTCLVLFIVAIPAFADEKPNPRRSVEGYVAAVLAGKADDAKALAVEGQSPAKAKSIEKLKALLNVKTLKISSVHASEKKGQAVAVSEAVKLTKANPDGRDTGCLVFTLVRSGGRWLLKDIDFRTEADAREKVKAFLKKNPDAQEQK